MVAVDCPYGPREKSPDTWTENEANFRVITPGYFKAMGARLLRGRSLADSDNENRLEVTVIDHVLAERKEMGSGDKD